MAYLQVQAEFDIDRNLPANAFYAHVVEEYLNSETVDTLDMMILQERGWRADDILMELSELTAMVRDLPPSRIKVKVITE